MKKVILLLIIVFMTTGCQQPITQKAVEVIIDGDGRFPEFLVGRWKTDDYGWQFVFEPDGTISSAVFNMGHVEVIPGQTVTVPTKGGGKAIFKPGLWTVQYSSKTQNLLVEIVMDHIHFEMGPSLLEGKRKDLFSGEVSEDGRVWQADWFSFPDYMAYASQTKRLTVKPDESFVKVLIFEKVEE